MVLPCIAFIPVALLTGGRQSLLETEALVPSASHLERAACPVHQGEQENGGDEEQLLRKDDLMRLGGRERCGRSQVARVQLRLTHDGLDTMRTMRMSRMLSQYGRLFDRTHRRLLGQRACILPVSMRQNRRSTR